MVWCIGSGMCCDVMWRNTMCCDGMSGDATVGSNVTCKVACFFRSVLCKD